MRGREIMCAFWEGGGKALHVVTYDGSSWSGPLRVLPSTIELNTTPALAAFEEDVYCLHRIANTDPHLIGAVFDGTSWNHDAYVAVNSMLLTPAAVVRGEALYAIFQDYRWPGQLRVSRKAAGGPWEGPPLGTNDANVVGSPAAATLGAAIHVVYAGGTGARSDGTLRWRTLVGREWSPEQQIARTGGGATPSVAAFGGQLHAFHPEAGSAKQLCCAVLEAEGRWLSDAPVPPTSGSAQGGSAAVAYDNRLYLLYRTTTNQLAVATFDGREWSALPQPSPAISLPAEPAATVY
jgi:hypothetical protein